MVNTVITDGSYDSNNKNFQILSLKGIIKPAAIKIRKNSIDVER